MRIAFAYWKDRIAPVFDTARFIRLVDTENYQVLGQADEPLTQELPLPRVERLVELRVGTLVCGAISRQLEAMITTRGIKVIPFVGGELDTVVEAFLCRRLRDDSFKMPGCCGRRRHRDPGARCGGRSETPIAGPCPSAVLESGKRSPVSAPGSGRPKCCDLGREDGAPSGQPPGTLKRE